MVEAREDGIYIRLAGSVEDGEVFTLDWAKVFQFEEKSRTQSFAEQELDILEATVPDAIVTPFRNEILALCEAFGRSGQSGGSAPYTATAISKAVKKLMLREPICPVTGIDEEWVDVAEINGGETLYQNKRCTGLFKDGSGKSLYIDAIVKKTEESGCWSGSFWLSKDDYLSGDKSKMIHSCQYVKSFPFEPKTFYIDVIEEEVAKDDWEMYAKDPKQLEKVWEYYDKK